MTNYQEGGVKEVRWETIGQPGPGERKAAVVRLTGDIDMHHSPAVHEAIVEVCDQQPALLVIDLQDVHYMDSSGIGTLVDIFRRVNGYGGQLSMCSLNERVRSVFEITRLDKFFKIYPSVAEALAG